MPLAPRNLVNRRVVIVGATIAAAAAIAVFMTTQIWRPHSVLPPWIYGHRDARFTIVLYADIKCPYCRQYIPQLREWIDRHQEVKLEWHHFPLDAHEPDATQAAVAAECAGRRGGSTAFWQTAESLLAGRDPSPLARLDELAACNGDQTVRQWVRSQAADASAQGIQGTPTLRLLDSASSESMILPGIVDDDALLSAIDLLDSGAGDSR